MTLTYEQLMSWEPAQIEAVGDQLNTLRKKLIDQQDEMSTGRVPGTWQGESAERAKSRYDKLHDQLNDLAAPVSQVRDAVDEAAADIKSAKRAAKAAFDAILAKDYKVETANSNVVLTSPPPASTKKMTDEEAEEAEAKAEHDAAQVREFQGELLDALRKAEQADLTLNSVLTSAANNRIDGGDGSIRQAAMPPEFAGLSPKEIAVKMADDPERYREYEDLLTKEQKEALGKEIARRFGSIDDPIPTMGDRSGLPSSRESQDLTTLLKAFGDEPAVGAAFATSLGAGGAFTVLSNTGIQGFPHGDDVANAIRATIAAGSNAPGFDANEFGKDIVNEATNFHDRHPGAYSDTSGTLTHLLQGKGFSDEFVGGAANELDRFERDDPDAARDWYGKGPNRDADHDAMAAIMTQLGDHPKVGFDFFDDPEKRAYYFSERGWGADGYAGIAHAIDGIGTDSELREQDQRAVSRIVGSFFDRIPEYNDKWTGEAFTWDEASKGSADIAHLLGTYAPALDMGINGDGHDTAGPDGLVEYRIGDSKGLVSDLPYISKDDAAAFMKVAMATPDGAASLAHGLGEWRQTQVNYIAHELDGLEGAERLECVRQFEPVFSGMGRIDGFAEHALGELEIANAKDVAKSQSFFFNALGKAGGYLPVPDNAIDAAQALSNFGRENDGAGFPVGEDAPKEDRFTSVNDASTDAGERAAEGSNRLVMDVMRSLAMADLADMSPHDRQLLMPGGEFVDFDSLSESEKLTVLGAARTYVSPYVNPDVLDETYRKQFQDFYE